MTVIYYIVMSNEKGYRELVKNVKEKEKAKSIILKASKNLEDFHKEKDIVQTYLFKYLDKLKKENLWLKDEIVVGDETREG
ncbi:hypothetical protein K2173_005708 [Erythroxylum novogranatense]|uniref:Uncharacterized protein n=1 Tax=Erythroxylum novogranatense TaxID=1862640 RepID=A0AAV8SQK0_9ROSI|nr:hypothetical protein K2173_005708 [Erythroxylum novogranatense]